MIRKVTVWFCSKCLLGCSGLMGCVGKLFKYCDCCKDFVLLLLDLEELVMLFPLTLWCISGQLCCRKKSWSLSFRTLLCGVVLQKVSFWVLLCLWIVEFLFWSRILMWLLDGNLFPNMCLIHLRVYYIWSLPYYLLNWQPVYGGIESEIVLLEISSNFKSTDKCKSTLFTAKPCLVF